MNECDYPQCNENSNVLVGCYITYHTIANYCDVHAKQLSYCRNCGFKSSLNEDGVCKSCSKMQDEARLGWWRE